MSALGEFGNFLIGGLTAGLNSKSVKRTNATNLQIAQETNAANLQIAQDTNAANIQMNAENNALQQQLAEQAYQRSTASNQIAELIKSGFTQQQAMMAVLGEANPAQMPMPTTAAGHADPAVMNPVTMNPADYSAMAKPFTGSEDSLFSALTSSLNAPDGGSLGWSVAQDYISGLMDFVDDGTLPADKISSPADLLEYINSLEDGDTKSKLKSFIDSDASKKVRRFVPAQRAVYNFMRQNMAFKTEGQQIKESLARTKDTYVAARLKESQITGQDIVNSLNTLGLTYQEFQNQIADLTLDFMREQMKKMSKETELLEAQIDEQWTRAYILNATASDTIEATCAQANAIMEECLANAEYYRNNKENIQAMLTQNLTLVIECAAAQILNAKNEQTLQKQDAEVLPALPFFQTVHHAWSRLGYSPFGEFSQFGSGLMGLGVGAAAGGNFIQSGLNGKPRPIGFQF